MSENDVAGVVASEALKDVFADDALELSDKANFLDDCAFHAGMIWLIGVEGLNVFE